MKTLTSWSDDLGRQLAARARVRGIRTLARDTGLSAAWVSQAIRGLEANPLRWRGWSAYRLIRMCGPLGIDLEWVTVCDPVSGRKRPGRPQVPAHPDQTSV